MEPCRVGISTGVATPCPTTGHFFTTTRSTTVKKNHHINETINLKLYIYIILYIGTAIHAG
jgi:hypothetical protein